LYKCINKNNNETVLSTDRVSPSYWRPEDDFLELPVTLAKQSPSNPALQHDGPSWRASSQRYQNPTSDDLDHRPDSIATTVMKNSDSRCEKKIRSVKIAIHRLSVQNMRCCTQPARFVPDVRLLLTKLILHLSSITYINFCLSINSSFSESYEKQQETKAAHRH